MTRDQIIDVLTNLRRRIFEASKQVDDRKKENDNHVGSLEDHRFWASMDLRIAEAEHQLKLAKQRYNESLEEAAKGGEVTIATEHDRSTEL